MMFSLPRSCRILRGVNETRPKLATNSLVASSRTLGNIGLNTGLAITAVNTNLPRIHAYQIYRRLPYGNLPIRKVYEQRATDKKPKTRVPVGPKPKQAAALRIDGRPRVRDHQSLYISEEVRRALKNNQPVVALETTIYTHGFPYPDNVSLAFELEKIVRQKGAVPATIGILHGEARIGLSPQDIVELASAAGKPETMKVSRRDIPYILGLGVAGRKLNGGTTVSGTMVLARRAGIKVFGTGGLGGVHRGAEDSMDISADLTELGRTSVAVVSSGCKSFLDIQRTLEYLETQGVPVCTFADGREGDVDFPAFYTRDSGVKSHGVVQNAREAAAIIYAHEMFGRSRAFRSGVLFANPIPTKFAIPKEEIDAAINQAVKEAADQGIHGHANTPFILSRIKDLTKGSSLSANRALIESNVAMAASVAAELCSFRARKPKPVQNRELKTENQNLLGSTAVAETGAVKFINNAIEIEASKNNHDIHVIGSVAVDLSCDHIGQQGELSPQGTNLADSPQLNTSNIATIVPSIGGVGHNVALAAQRAGGASSVQLCSFIADDLAGKTVLATLKDEGLDTSGIETLPASSNRTAQYVAINDGRKDLVLAMADMNIFATKSTESLTRRSTPTGLKWAVVDANWQKGSIRKLISHYSNMRVRVAFEPVSVAKCAGLFEHDPTVDPEGACTLRPFPDTKLDLATPNQYELAAMHAAAKKHGYFESDAWWRAIDALGIPSSGAHDRFVSITSHKITDEGIPQQAIQLLPLIPTILTKLGVEGVLVTKLLQPNDSRLDDDAYAPYILSRCSNGSKDIGGVYMRLFPAVETVEDVVSVNGVGDTFLGVLVAGLAKGLQLEEQLINIAQKGAILTLRSKESVSPQLGELSTELDALVKDGARAST